MCCEWWYLGVKTNNTGKPVSRWGWLGPASMKLDNGKCYRSALFPTTPKELVAKHLPLQKTKNEVIQISTF